MKVIVLGYATLIITSRLGPRITSRLGPRGEGSGIGSTAGTALYEARQRLGATINRQPRHIGLYETVVRLLIYNIVKDGDCYASSPKTNAARGRL